MNRKQQVSISALIEALDTYGGDPSNWPLELREQYARHADLPEVRAARQGNAELDTLLAELQTPALSQDVRRQLLEQISLEQRQQAIPLRRWFNELSLLWRAAFAAMAISNAALAGLSTALLIQERPTPEQEFIYYLHQQSNRSGGLTP